MTEYMCRIAKLRVDGSWDYRVLNVTRIGFSSKDSAMVVHPIVMRFVSTIITVDTNDPAAIEAQSFPTLICDFRQVDEKLPFSCIYVGTGASDGAKFIDCMNYFSRLREWLYAAKNVSTNKLYLQFFVQNPSDNDDPQAALDPLRVPLGVAPGFGWRGTPIDLTLKDFEAGDGSIEMSITWQHGVVIPV